MLNFTFLIGGTVFSCKLNATMRGESSRKQALNLSQVEVDNFVMSGSLTSISGRRW